MVDKNYYEEKKTLKLIFISLSFFPEVVQPVIGVIGNSFFLLLVRLKICKKPQRTYDVSAPTTITVSLPGTDPQDAERRR